MMRSSKKKVRRLGLLLMCVSAAVVGVDSSPRELEAGGFGVDAPRWSGQLGGRGAVAAVLRPGGCLDEKSLDRRDAWGRLHDDAVAARDALSRDRGLDGSVLSGRRHGDGSCEWVEELNDVDRTSSGLVEW